MGTRWKRFALLGGLAAFLHPLAAGACGGGTVSAVPGSIATDTQRIFISARATTTEVVTQIIVPESTADYGGLIPAPAQPALDSVPVDQKELDALDRATAPQINVGVESESDDSGGCMCLPVSGDAGDSTGSTTSIGVRLSEPVDIGPVTAVVMTGETASAVNDWLQAMALRSVKRTDRSSMPMPGPASISPADTFVLEGMDSSAWLRLQSGVGPTLLGWLDDDAKLTRLSARFRSALS